MAMLIVTSLVSILGQSICLANQELIRRSICTLIGNTIYCEYQWRRLICGITVLVG